MAKVSKDMLIGQLLQVDSYESRNALSRMPVIPDGVSGRGCYGSWSGCRCSGKPDQ